MKAHLWTRLLGYGGTALLITAAVAVLVVQFTGKSGGSGRPVAGGQGGTAAPGQTSGGQPQSGQATGADGQPAGGGQSGQSGQSAPSGSGGYTGVVTCGPSSAGYARSGNTLRVSVTLPQDGVVSASVLLRGQSEPQTRSINVQGEQSPHVFEFTDAPAAATRSIKVSVLSSTAFKTCSLLK